MFEYSADNIHDRRPLIWVLEIKGDRIWGLNLHYNFSILGDIINFKKNEVKNKVPKVDNSKKEEENKGEENTPPSTTLPNIVDAQIKSVNTPTVIKNLDDFSNYPIGKNSEILRNYLHRNIRNSYKLYLKP